MIKKFENFVSSEDPYGEEVWDDELIPKERFKKRGKNIYLHLGWNRNLLIGYKVKFNFFGIADEYVHIDKYFVDRPDYNEKCSRVTELDDETYDFLIVALTKWDKKMGVPNDYLKRLLV